MNKLLMNKLQPGDIFATEGRGISGWAVRKLIDPPTDRFHFGILYRKEDSDWVILESVTKGIAIGLLSWYDASKLKFYRVDCPIEVRRKAPLELITYGRAWYDYFLIIKFLLGYAVARARLLANLDFRKVIPEDFPYVRYSMLICTEAVAIGYSGVGLIPRGVVPMPNSFRQAEVAGRMKEIAI